MRRIADILTEAVRLGKADAAALAAILLISSVVLAALDVYSSEGMALLLASAAGILVDALVNFRMIRKTGLARGHIRPRIAGLFGLQLLMALPILAGLALLVLPGIYLWARWYIAYPILVAEDLGVTEAMRRSWRLTKGRELSLAPIAVGPFVLLIMLVFGTELSGFAISSNFSSALVYELLIGLPIIGRLVLAVAAWSVIAQSFPVSDAKA